MPKNKDKIYLTHEMFQTLLPVLDKVELLKGIIDKRTVKTCWDNAIKKLDQAFPGANQEELAKIAEQTCERPGHSKHELGLAVDLVLKGMNDPIKYTGIKTPELLKTGSKRVPPFAAQKRQELVEIMSKIKLKNSPNEFWHFDLNKEVKLGRADKKELENKAKQYSVELISKSKLPIVKL